MGDASDQTKGLVQGMIDDGVERTKSVVEETADKAIGDAQELVSNAADGHAGSSAEDAADESGDSDRDRPFADGTDREARSNEAVERTYVGDRPS